MAKAKVLADTISITSEILTNENIRKVKALAPATLKIVDENEGELYSIDSSENYVELNRYGAVFKDGVTVGRVPNFEFIADDKREEVITNYLLPILTRINAIEDAVDVFLNNNEYDNIEEDIEFI